jgi:peptidyl-prolyl cis-trans isomerase D
MRIRRLSLIVLGTVAPLVACDGLQSADTVAKAGGQQLTVERLGNLLGGSGAPVTKETARAITDLWTNYQLVAAASVKGDSMAGAAEADSALQSVFNRMLVDRWQRDFVPTLQAKVDTTQFAQRYADGAIFHARHILLSVPQDATPAKKAELKAKIDAIRARVTPATFAATATKESNDPGSAPRGGLLGAFQKGQMVPQFEQGTAATAPGEISPVIESQFGYHIIYRSTYAEAKGDVAPQLVQAGMASAESTFVAGLEKEAGMDVKANAVATLRTLTGDLTANLGNTTVLASLKGGNFTARDAAMLLLSIPQRGQLIQQISGAPDSVVREQLIKPMVRTELVLRAAKAAGTQLDTAEVGQVRRSFSSALQAAWNGLGVSPQVLADSAKDPATKATFAATRVETMLDRVVAGQMPLVQVPVPVELALRKKYPASFSLAALDKAVEKAKAVRAQSDSARKAAVPQSVVPIPGGADKALPTTPPTDAKAPAAAPAAKKPE